MRTAAEGYLRALAGEHARLREDQWTAIRALVAEGVREYDLGTDREYKHRWADRLFVTHTIAFVTHRAARSDTP